DHLLNLPGIGGFGRGGLGEGSAPVGLFLEWGGGGTRQRGPPPRKGGGVRGRKSPFCVWETFEGELWHEGGGVFFRRSLTRGAAGVGSSCGARGRPPPRGRGVF